MAVTKYVITNNLSVLYNTREEAEDREDEQFVQPLNSNGKPLCTIAKTNIIAIKECK